MEYLPVGIRYFAPFCICDRYSEFTVTNINYRPTLMRVTNLRSQDSSHLPT